jgi:hypothetical protein
MEMAVFTRACWLLCGVLIGRRTTTVRGLNKYLDVLASIIDTVSDFD